jgi:MFS family permease
VARGGLLRLFKNRQLLTLSAAGFFLIYGQWVMLTWGPSFLFKERGLSLNQAGLYTALVAIPSIAGALLWGRLSDRVGRRRMLLMVAPFAAFAIFGVAFFGSLKLLLLFLIIYGFTGSLAINPMMVAWAGDIATESKGIGLASAIGVLNAISVGGSIVAPVISGWFLDLTGSLAPAFYVASGCVATGMLLCFLTREARRATA